MTKTQHRNSVLMAVPRLLSATHLIVRGLFAVVKNGGYFVQPVTAPAEHIHSAHEGVTGSFMG